MDIIDIPADRSLLLAWTARQARARTVMVRRRLIPWHVRKQPEMAQQLLTRIDTALKKNARDYTRGSP